MIVPKSNHERNCLHGIIYCIFIHSVKNNDICKKRIHFAFPLEGGRTAEAFQSPSSHTDGKIQDGYGKDGCEREVVGTERLILTQHSPYL
jgi:hypothetical protein